MKKFFLVPLIIIIVAVLLIGGCGGGSSSTTTQTSTSSTTQTTNAPAEQKVLKIGASLAMNNARGMEGGKWLDLYAKLINDAGGWKIGNDTYKLEFVTYDNQNDVQKGKNDLERLVLQDGVKFILGSPTQSAAVDTSVTEPNKVICFGGDMSDTSSGPEVKYYYAVFGTFARGLMYDIDKDMMDAGIKNYVAVKADNEQGKWAEALCDATWQLVAGDQIEKLGVVYYPTDAVDFGPIATKVIAMEPDLVDLNFDDVLVQMYGALSDAGYEGTILPSYCDEAMLNNIVTKVGPEFVEGGECVSQDPRGFQKDADMLAEMDAYTQEYGTFRTDGIMTVMSWYLLKDAINKTQSVDVEVVNNYLGSSTGYVRCLTGYLQLFARPDKENYRTCHSNAPDYIARITDGTLHVTREVPVKTHYLCSIQSYGWEDIYKAYWEQYGYPTFPPEQVSSLNFSDLGITGHD